MRISIDDRACSGVDCCACSDACAAEFRMEAPVGQVIGYAKQLLVVCLYAVYPLT